MNPESLSRRNFLAASLATAASATAHGLLRAADESAETTPPPAREYYELTLYHLRRGPKQKLFDTFMQQAAIPALNRAGIGPVGVFNVMFGPDNPTAYVLLPLKSPEGILAAHHRILADPDFQSAGNDFLGASPDSPAFIRAESSFMVAFEGIPKLEVPAAAAGNKPRIFELRTYESHSRRANIKKIEMFNIGEIALFRRTGLTPVFFGETLVGPRLPNLTYMLTFENMAARDAHWATFVADPEWKKMSSTPGYTDPEIVSNISNTFLRPAPYSQI
ncbi:MAG: NIPSNAP family protein [Verrucomicrobiae bacterium]|nr:NIPSNAP family protein [Verrucomicrobiae bacterium]